LTFYNAMRARGVSDTLAKIMYAAVYHFGPRWPDPVTNAPPVARTLSEADFEKLKRAIAIREEKHKSVEERIAIAADGTRERTQTESTLIRQIPISDEDILTDRNATSAITLQQIENLSSSGLK
jgi:hypothetical protein